MQKDETKPEVIMSRLLKSSDKLSLELLATDTIGDRNVPLEFLDRIVQTTFPGGANPLVQPAARPRGGGGPAVRQG